MARAARALLQTPHSGARTNMVRFVFVVVYNYVAVPCTLSRSRLGRHIPAISVPIFGFERENHIGIIWYQLSLGRL